MHTPLTVDSNEILNKNGSLVGECVLARDAETIVLAVNSHEALLEALKGMMREPRGLRWWDKAHAAIKQARRGSK